MWTQLFSIITVVTSLVVVIRKFPAAAADIRYSSIAALSAWLIGDIVLTISIPYRDIIHVVSQSLALSLLLIVFLVFIRQRKPVIFRYPYYMVYIPLLIPIAQLIVMETQMMRDIIFMALHGISILVFILLSAAYSRELQNKLLTIVGVILLLWGFSFYWILQEYFIVFDWAWGLTNSTGMIASIYSFSDLLAINNKL